MFSRSQRRLCLAAIVSLVVGILIPPATQAADPIASIVPASSQLPNFTLDSSGTYALSGYRVTGPADRDLLIGISLDTAPSGDYLSLTTTGLTPSYGFTSGQDQLSGFTQITFVGRLADINSNLTNGFRYHSANGEWSNTIKISLSVTEDVAGIAYYPRDGHYYKVGHFTNSGSNNAFCEDPGTAATDYINSYSEVETLERLNKGDPACTWSKANELARAGTLKSRPGYLANITSVGENEFLQSKLQGALNVWIGGTDGGRTGASSYTPVNDAAFNYFTATSVPDSMLSGLVGTEGLWRFYDGPEKGKVFWRQKLNVGVNWPNWESANEYTGYSPSTNSNIQSADQDVLSYTNWSTPAEPNNTSSATMVTGGSCGQQYCGEDNIVFNWNAANGNWNDLSGNEATVPFYGYVVEYGDETPFTGSSKAIASISTSSNCYESFELTGGKKVLKFAGNAACTWNKPSGITSVEILAVAGGGGGGSACVGGGGGAGGFLQTVNNNFQASSVTISVGRGGAGGAGTGCAHNRGQNGQDTELTFSGQTLTLYGGGGGGEIGPRNGYSGGSGGGGSGLSTQGGSGFSSQGSDGGNGTNGGGNTGGGGGGASSVGGNSGDGGSGFTLNVLGFNENFAGGGGGGSDDVGGIGGQSCGGNGASRNDNHGGVPVAATAANGYGCGGGGGNGNEVATAGSKGVVYISYVVATPPSNGGGGGFSAPVAPVAPECLWKPVDLFEGESIGSEQLNALFNVPGSVTYSIKPGFKPTAGTVEITANFTPLDLAGFMPITVSRQITVRPVITSDGTEASTPKLTKLTVIYFNSNEYFLDRNDRQELIAVSKALKSVPANKLIVEGNTDVKKGVDNNWLSKSRAKAVAQYMKSQGIKPKLIKLWFGPSKPAVKAKDRASLALNRRVEIYVAE